MTLGARMYMYISTLETILFPIIIIKPVLRWQPNISRSVSSFYPNKRSKIRSKCNNNYACKIFPLLLWSYLRVLLSGRLNDSSHLIIRGYSRVHYNVCLFLTFHNYFIKTAVLSYRNLQDKRLKPVHSRIEYV